MLKTQRANLYVNGDWTGSSPGEAPPFCNVGMVGWHSLLIVLFTYNLLGIYELWQDLISYYLSLHHVWCLPSPS